MRSDAAREAAAPRDRMSTVKRNAIANFFGTLYSGVVVLVAVPLYVRWLGAEAYGLIAIHAIILLLVVFLDLGLATALNREVAFLSAEGKSREIRAALRTAQLFYIAIALLFAAAALIAAPIIASRWLAPRALPLTVVTASLRLICAAVAIHFAASAYQAVLLGLQRHVLFNALNVSIVTLRIGGSLVVAALTSRIEDVLWWQLAVTVAQLVMFGVAATRVLPASDPVGFELRTLSRPFQFARGVAVISVLAALTSQMDKIIASRLLSLSQFAYYNIAASLAMVTVAAASAIAVSIYPRFSELIAQGDTAELSLSYHRAAQTVSVLVLPFMSVALFFPREMLYAWTADASVVAVAATILPVLVVAWTLNALTHVPYMLHLAAGMTAPTIAVHAVAIVVIVPATAAAGMRFGTVGIALGLLVMNLAALVVCATVTHHRLVRDGGLFWLRTDILAPLIVSSVAAASVRLFAPPATSRLTASYTVVLAGFVAAAAAAAATPIVRVWLGEMWRSRAVSSDVR